MTVTTSMSVGRADGSAQPPAQIYVGDATGAAKRVKSIYVGRKDGTPVQVFNDTGSNPPPASTATNSISPSSQTVNASPNQSVTFNAVAMASDNAQNYTWTWFYRLPNGTTGDTGTGPNMSFSASVNQAGQTVTFTFVSNLNDQSGNLVSQASATATLKT